jgi:methylamine utilization protein MauJ
MKEQKPATTSASLPLSKLGLPGASYQLHAHGAKSGQPRTAPSTVLPDTYRVVLTLTKNVVHSHSLSFASGLSGDSYIQFAKPEKERAESDADEMVVFYGHDSQRIELRGIANPEGRLGKVIAKVPAGSFAEAENVAFGAASPFLSSLSFEFDVPLRVAQMDVTQLSTGNSSMTYTCPYNDLVPAVGEFSNVPYIQSLLSLYREGINSQSPNYQYLCWYKIVEGINVKREEETAKSKAALPMKFPERVEKTKLTQRKRLEEAFPFIKTSGTSDSAWDDLVPDEVSDWKFNRVRQHKLEPLRNKIAHMISEPSGDLSLSPDSRDTVREVTRWISLLRFIARVMTLNESARIPRPQIFRMPSDPKHISEMRDAFRKPNG